VTVECLTWYGDREHGGSTCHRPKDHPAVTEDGIGHATAPTPGDDPVAQVLRAARGLVRTAHPTDVGKHEVVRQWWDSLVAAVEQLPPD
jgi:hypothetical protein